MKKVILALCSIVVAIGANAAVTTPAQVNFAANVVGEYDSPVFLGTVASGVKATSDYLVQLYAGPTATSLAAVGDAIPFRTAKPGYWSAATRTIPTVEAGQPASLQ